MSSLKPTLAVTDGDGPRFAFGRNWIRFLALVDEARIAEAVASLVAMLGRKDLRGVRFLDAGCGSGLFSLAAQRLGAEVVSFDYDPDSVRCTELLYERYGRKDGWRIVRGDVLDRAWLEALGAFDIVYSWGVVHHTGDLWRALDNIAGPVAAGGDLFVSVYNDQGPISRVWARVKQAYNRSPALLQQLMAAGYFAYLLLMRTARGIARRLPSRDWYRASGRGMSLWHDAIDWLGGYPFETAKPTDVERVLHARGFVTRRRRLRRGLGCNEFVFRKAMPRA